MTRPKPTPATTASKSSRKAKPAVDAAPAQAPQARADKQPFDIDVALERISQAVQPFPKAGLFELAEDGFNSTFQQLVACIISIRTYDEVMLPTARRLFAAAHTPEAVSRLTPAQIDELINACTFHEPKAQTIHDIARRTVEAYNGDLPCDAETLMALKGVGPKCANLVLSIACGQPFIAVDVHVHRITNRWKPFNTKTPEQTMVKLEQWLPKTYWVDINRLLVPFGKHICTGKLPKCSTCPILEMCEQIGVNEHR
ncbi:MAG: endonuclease III [Abitibacteriaceae bacterium]|nr:endonuclease III [Abditibacteriaceae bacterium]